MKTNLLKLVSIVAFLGFFTSCSTTDKNVWSNDAVIKTYDLTATKQRFTYFRGNNT